MSLPRLRVKHTITIQRTAIQMFRQTLYRIQLLSKYTIQHKKVKVTSFKINSTNNSKASAKKVTMEHGQKKMETFMKTPVSQGLKQKVRSHTPPTPPDRQDDQIKKNNG
jgi:hypothetical protein